MVGKPSNKFGQRRSEAGSNLNWQGVFIPSNEGNNVRSIYHGRVAFAEWMRGLGLLIIVDHGDGFMSLYGHNQSLFKQVGINTPCQLNLLPASFLRCPNLLLGLPTTGQYKLPLDLLNPFL